MTEPQKLTEQEQQLMDDCEALSHDGAWIVPVGPLGHLACANTKDGCTLNATCATLTQALTALRTDLQERAVQDIAEYEARAAKLRAALIEQMDRDVPIDD